MPEETDRVPVRKGRLPARLGPAVMLAGAVVTIAVVFLPWAKLAVTDPNLQVRNGWYSGLELVFPAVLILLMLIPVVFSVIMLAGKGTVKRNLEVGFCAFACGMEFLLLVVLLLLNVVLQDISTKVSLFKITMGAGFWIALALVVVNVAAVVLTAYGTRPNPQNA
ncbi:MAG: hypothetical protein ACYC99_04665 [Candidatus Geothermincolia bacterium]